MDDFSEWMQQVNADLKTAKDNIRLRNYYASVVFSQQVAEKSLKALYLLIEEKTPPKLHDLVELARRVEAPKYVVEAAAKLTVTYFFSRYPGAAPEIPAKYYTKEKAESHLKEAEVILIWVRKKTQ